MSLTFLQYGYSNFELEKNVNEKEIQLKGSIGEKHKNTEKLNSENNNTKIEENGTESEKDKTDFAKKTSHKNKFYVK